MDVKGGGASYLSFDILPRQYTLGKVDGRLGMDQASVLPTSGPFFRNIHHSQIQYFQQTIISRKHRFGLGYLAQLTVETPQWRWWCRSACAPPGGLEIGAEIGPIGPPELGDFRVFLVLALPKGVQSIQGCLLIHGGIDRLQIGRKSF